MERMVTTWQAADGRDIAAPILKLLWARERMQALQQQVAAWRAVNPNPVVVDIDDETGRQRHRLGPMAPLSAAVSLTLGDFVQCLRSSLDHAVYYIAQPDVGDEATAEFPVYLYKHRTQVAGRNFPGFDDRNRGWRAIRLLPDAAKDFVVSQQPYNREGGLDPTGHPLWGLHTLANLDRHRTIPVVVTVARPLGLEYLTPNTPVLPPEPEVEWHGQGSHDGDPIVTTPRVDATYEHFQLHVKVDVVLNEPGFPALDVLTLCDRLYRYVAWAMAALEPYFPNSRGG